MSNKELIKALKNCGGEIPYGECFRNCHHDGNRPCSKLRDELMRNAADAIEQLEIESAALRARLEQVENKPFSIDELKQINADMENHPWVWVEILIPSGCCEKGHGYYRVQYDYACGECFACGYPGISFPFAYTDYGKTWLAYQHKPD